MEILRHTPRKSVGLGLLLNRDLQVLEVVAGGPCEGKVSLGDVISEINGKTVQGKLPRDIACLIAGDEGSQVTLKVRRELSCKEIIRKQIELGKKKRDSTEVAKVFASFSKGMQGKCIDKDKFLEALKAFDVAKDILPNDPQKIDELFESLDRNGDKVLDLKEFTHAVRNPTILENLTRPLPLHQLLAECIPVSMNEDPILATSQLTPEKIEIIADEFNIQLKEMLCTFVKKLQVKYDELGKFQRNSKAPKFQQEVPRMKCGDIDDFHNGLAGRVGVPSLDFLTAMELEHCSKGGHDVYFTTSNHDITTSPSCEWSYVVKRDKVCPEVQKKSDRVIPEIQELLDKDVAKRAKLTRPEVIAVLLYSGPMFHVYNAVLRQWPDDTFTIYKDFDNLFPCTIFVLTSALQKLSRVTQLEPGMKLYRGLKPKVNLPEFFFKCDRHGCTGFTEWAFMSTTAKIDVALIYSQSKDDGADVGNPRVLEIQVGSVDRGASIKEFSQYPDEDEYMYVPCSFIEKAGDITVNFDQKVLVEVVSVKVNSNLKTKTVEELVQQRKDMHIAAFAHVLNQLESELKKMAATERRAEIRLSQDKSAGDNLTVDGFITRIMGQCRDVLSRHQAVSSDDYVNHRMFRSLLLEMADTKTNARAKLEEWIENPASFIRYRWNLDLIQVGRRWHSYLEEKRFVASNAGEDTEKYSKELCCAMGLIVESVTEVNALGETRLMWAAAEGRSARILRLLVDARCNVNHKRADGVTPLWLAAENGHEECIRTLFELKAEVDHSVNDGTTPLCIAARNGKRNSVELLVSLGATVNKPGSRGLRPVHEAAMYGFPRTLQSLVNLKADINITDAHGFTPYHVAFAAGQMDLAELIVTKHFGTRSIVPTHTDVFDGMCRRLIVSTGDISDIDGFFALAEYAKLHADVIFVMNYPAYIGVNEDEVSEDYASKNPGLGYKYSAAQVLQSVPAENSEQYNAYKRLMDKYVTAESDNEKMKRAMTDVAFAIAHGIWNEVPEHGELLFYIGGINSINPFSSTAIKNEVLVYSQHLNVNYNLQPTQGGIYGKDGKPVEIQWKRYRDIYMDFNGSLAFWSGFLASKLSEQDIVSKIQGVFVMGGVYADRVPITMPSIPGVLNRFSSATMNQLYHPQNAANFLAFLAQFNIPTYTVTNNVVEDLTTFSDDDKKVKTFDGVEAFLTNNKLEGPLIKQLAKAHYLSKYNPPRKAFDYYTACALRTLLESPNKFPHAHREGIQRTPSYPVQKYLFISNVYGVTFVSPYNTWEDTRAAYSKVVDTEIKEDDSEFIKTKKNYFSREIEIMRSIHYLASMPVVDLEFHLDKSSKFLTLLDAPPPAPISPVAAQPNVSSTTSAASASSSEENQTQPDTGKSQ